MKAPFIALLCATTLLACTKPAEKPAEPVAEVKPTPDIEFADAKYAEIGKKGMNALASGDIDAWMATFADNARYHWSSGDSLVGKQAIHDYWKDRRSKVIDSISFVNDIWLPVEVNKPQRGPDRAGVWLFSWYMVKVKYKNNQKLAMWIHNDMHFDANDKIDIMVQYLDRAPINAALAKKK
ncbi:nuclear transport factor 2 family protein [Chryseolinea soli]|uniref:Nuclear transport factor 2 family protein n=1 Tax=Chryseolinea soli TaxID=2321403 RepID=A0A385SLU1_9BACT|nr:nuclear transport factor 2 family protein [Chryseolinea soli]AYB29978.1 nuclear transport factor 2 family protein [Chryseolinea soli]